MSDIVLDIAVGIAVSKTFHYLAPETLKDRLAPGSRVLVPFGSRKMTGTVVGLPERAERKGLKQIIEIQGPPLAAGLLELGRWLSDYYLHPLGMTIETMTPKAVLAARPRTRKLLALTPGDHDVRTLRGKKQAELLLLLCDRQLVPMEELAAFSASTIKALCAAGMAGVVEQEVEPGTAAETVSPDAPPELMPEQAEAVKTIGDRLASGSFGVFLLHGVTGSGKTEVYLHAIKHLACTGRGAIVLAPEIALTPQLVGRFRRRFGGRIAVLHSGLTDRERADEYRRIREGRVDVAIGARSAVFAPFERLGLVIVDEEQENSYKQDEGLRYSARDTAVMRAKIQNAVCVLGSATPSLESASNARQGKYRLLAIANRVDHRPLPAVEIVDARSLPKGSSFTPRLAEGLRLRLERGEQSLLLLNRRGFSSVLICRDCGSVMKCPGCSVSLTYHKSEKKLKCHYCDFYTEPPAACPSCSGIALQPLGAGTQRIEEELASLFPHARISRMDSDSVKGRQAYDRLLGRVDRREIDILLGTQMVAKGHDFPAVTLVGVVDADVGLNLPDFRSAERTFQLVTQAAGRSGRGGTAGEVIIQTMNPEHYALRHSLLHDYAGFYADEIRFREQLGYPPFRRLVKIEVRSADEKTAGLAALAARDRIRKVVADTETTLLGPAPAPVSKVRGRYRYHLLILSAKREQLRTAAIEGRMIVEERFGRKCRVIVDVDPVHLM